MTPKWWRWEELGEGVAMGHQELHVQQRQMPCPPSGSDHSSATRLTGGFTDTLCWKGWGDPGGQWLKRSQECIPAPMKAISTVSRGTQTMDYQEVIGKWLSPFMWLLFAYKWNKMPSLGVSRRTILIWKILDDLEYVELRAPRWSWARALAMGEGLWIPGLLQLGGGAACQYQQGGYWEYGARIFTRRRTKNFTPRTVQIESLWKSPSIEVFKTRVDKQPGLNSCPALSRILNKVTCRGPFQPEYFYDSLYQNNIK